MTDDAGSSRSAGGAPSTTASSTPSASLTPLPASTRDGTVEVDSGGRVFPYAISSGSTDIPGVIDRTTAAQSALRSFHMDSVIRGTSASITQSATVVVDVDQSGTVRRTHVRVDGSGEKTDVVTVGAKVWVRDGQGWSASNEKNDVDLGTLANPFSRYLDIAVFADTAY
ncbi:hypothetical protein [Acidipropionibacterium thoenii]|uniref:hypothetical protein n=1 Tax=Acidipropionibacterium thoenii TaxID=1751 RepID=UPI001B7FD128|nr:hypothetical protein [Acidipropionibacterium thoenii]